MKIQTGLKTGNYVDTAQQALNTAGGQIFKFINSANAQAGNLANQLGNTWSSLIGKFG